MAPNTAFDLEAREQREHRGLAEPQVGRDVGRGHRPAHAQQVKRSLSALVGQFVPWRWSVEIDDMHVERRSKPHFARVDGDRTRHTESRLEEPPQAMERHV